MDIVLERFAYTPDGTFGRLTAGNETFWTVERPWVGNQRRKSCIPEGHYPMMLRDSGVVARSSKGDFTMGWEVCDVPGRSLIMIHPGNWMSDLLGCIAPGMTWGIVGDKIGVGSSQEAFRRLMAILSVELHHTLTISHFVPEYP